MTELDELREELAAANLRANANAAMFRAEQAGHAATRADLAHWRSNHASMVERARLLIERTDLPVERVRAYERMGEYHAALQRAGSAADLLAGDDLTTKLVPRIWLYRELLWNAQAYAAHHHIRLPFAELIAEHAAMSTDNG